VVEVVVVVVVVEVVVEVVVVVVVVEVVVEVVVVVVVVEVVVEVVVVVVVVEVVVEVVVVVVVVEVVVEVEVVVVVVVVLVVVVAPVVVVGPPVVVVVVVGPVVPWKVPLQLPDSTTEVPVVLTARSIQLLMSLSNWPVAKVVNPVIPFTVKGDDAPGSLNPPVPFPNNIEILSVPWLITTISSLLSVFVLKLPVLTEIGALPTGRPMLV